MRTVSYRLGMEAFIDGKVIEDNPYSTLAAGGALYNSWRNGFLDAGAEFAATHADLED